MAVNIICRVIFILFFYAIRQHIGFLWGLYIKYFFQSAVAIIKSINFSIRIAFELIDVFLSLLYGL